MGINWIPITGKWAISPDSVVYKGPIDPASPYGIVLSNQAFRDGHASVDMTFSSWNADSAARLLLGYDAKTEEYISVGLGGYGRAFVIDRFLSSHGWRAEKHVGDWTTLVADNKYHLDVLITGQSIVLNVDGIRVIDHQLGQPLNGAQVGLFMFGSNEVSFEGFRAIPGLPSGFVIMEFSGPYDPLYREVLLVVAEQEGVSLGRADEIEGPGVVLQDIVKGVAESTVVVAEITPPNRNVFYELGYAHALHKPVILLAKRGEALPFDVAGYRCIFYDDSISGKSGVEKEFRRHLKAILGKSILEERVNNH